MNLYEKKKIMDIKCSLLFEGRTQSTIFDNNVLRKIFSCKKDKKYSIKKKKKENSTTPIQSMPKWLDLEQRLLDKEETIDYEKQLRFEEARRHWQDLLQRFLPASC